MSQKLKIKGSFSDLKDSLKSLKSEYEKTEAEKPKQSVEEMQEKDIKNIQRHGKSNNIYAGRSVKRVVLF